MVHVLFTHLLDCEQVDDYLRGGRICDYAYMHNFKIWFSRLIVLLSLSQFTCTEKIINRNAPLSPTPGGDRSSVCYFQLNFDNINTTSAQYNTGVKSKSTLNRKSFLTEILNHAIIQVTSGGGGGRQC